MKYGEKSVGSAAGIDIPRDPSLPGLAALLDPEAVRAALTERLPQLAHASGTCRIHYLRYKPETNGIVAYGWVLAAPPGEPAGELTFYGKCYTEADYESARTKLETGRWISVPPLPPAVALPEWRSIFYFFPNDTELEGMRALADPKKIQRLLYRYLTPYASDDWRISDRRLRSRLIRFKPEKRVVVRFDTRATHRHTKERVPVTVYLRSYSDDRGEAMYRIMEDLFEHYRSGTGPRVPQPYGYDEERRLLFIEGLAGEPLDDRLNLASGVEAVRRTARALARLQTCTGAAAPSRTAESLMEDARSTGATLVHILPESQPRVEDLLARLLAHATRLRPASPGFVHGDFYHGQVLVDDQEIAIIDFDRSYRGDPLADPGNFCAHLHLAQLQGRIQTAAELERAFMEAYGLERGAVPEIEPIRFWTTLGLLQLAVRPFRSLEPGWPDAIRSILSLCERLCA